MYEYNTIIYYYMLSTYQAEVGTNSKFENINDEKFNSKCLADLIIIIYTAKRATKQLHVLYYIIQVGI